MNTINNHSASAITPTDTPQGCTQVPPLDKEMTCDVCGCPTPVPHVCSSGVGPVSFNYCDECLKRGAEPYSMVQFLIEDVVNYHPAYLSLATYAEGEYITLKDVKKRMAAE